MPFLAILGAAMLSRSMSADFEWLYALRVAAAGGALWYFRRVYKGLDFRFGWLGVAAGALVFVVWIALEPAGHSAAPAATDAGESDGQNRMDRTAHFWSGSDGSGRRRAGISRISAKAALFKRFRISGMEDVRMGSVS